MKVLTQPQCLVHGMSNGYTTTQGFYDSPVMLGAKRIKPERRQTMPINGLTEINRPPRQGMLRLGIKKKTQTGKEYPSEVDYFILDPETPDKEEKARLIERFHEAFGEKPKTIAITLPYSDLDEVFPQNYKRYGKNTSLKCIGDGITATCTETDFAQNLKTIGSDARGLPIVECRGRDCVFSTTKEGNKARECKATATLSVKIHPLGGLGVWQVTTGSFNSIVNINSCIRDLKDVYGRAHALPLVLERRPQITTFNGKKTTHYTLHINTDKSITEMIKQAQIAPERVLIEAYGSEVAALPAPEEIMDSEATQESEKLRSNWPGDVCNGFPEKGKVLDAEKTIDEPTHKLSDSIKGTAPDHPDKLAEYDKTTEKILETFSGEVEADQSPKIVFPQLFPKFMAFCKAQLETAGKGDMYRDAFHLYSVKTAADLEKDDKKQADIRKYLTGLVEEECNGYLR